MGSPVLEVIGWSWGGESWIDFLAGVLAADREHLIGQFCWVPGYLWERDIESTEVAAFAAC